MSKTRVCPRCRGEKRFVSSLTNCETLCGVCLGTGKVKKGLNTKDLLGRVRKIYACV